MSRPVLQLDRVGVDFGFGTVLGSVSFDLMEGQLCQIVGEVGVGKTTLIRVLAGEVAPSYGVVQRLAEAWYSPMGGTGLPQELTIAQIADANNLPTAVERAVALGVAHHDLARPIGELSYGNRQKAAVALSLASRASLMLYDEPFAGVDHASLPAMVEMLSRAGREGVAIAIASPFVDGLVPDVVVELGP